MLTFKLFEIVIIVVLNSRINNIEFWGMRSILPEGKAKLARNQGDV